MALRPHSLFSIDFTMCNPPFYASTTDLLNSAAKKSRPPHSACTGANVEMVTPGGEIAFVSRMIDESKALKERCHWYTSMLGKYSSVEIVVENLSGAGVLNWAVKDLVQGNKTRRWAVAWSWGDLRPRNVDLIVQFIAHHHRLTVLQDVVRGTTTLPKHLLPFPSEDVFFIHNLTLHASVERLNQILNALDLRWQYKSIITTGVGFAKDNVWSRSARRRQQQQNSQNQTHDQEMDPEDYEPALGFKVRLQQQKEEGVEVHLRWLKGRNSVLFESFCGMLRRQLTTA